MLLVTSLIKNVVFTQDNKLKPFSVHLTLHRELSCSFSEEILNMQGFETDKYLEVRLNDNQTFGKLIEKEMRRQRSE